MNDHLPDAQHSWSRETIAAHQWDRLNAQLEYLRGRNPFWTARLSAAGLDRGPVDEDRWRQLPLLTKADLVADQTDHPLYGTNLSEPLSAFTRLHQTSGTTGRPIYWLDTASSWDWFMGCWEQIYRWIGLRPEDVLAFPFSFGPFIGFWAAFEGANQLGNRCLAMGGLSSEARLRQILDHHCTVICCTPTYALRLAEVAHEMGIVLAESAVRAVVVAGEPGGSVPAIRSRIAEAWGARVFDHWGMTDLGSMGIEPEHAPGALLILESESIAEIIDPATGQPAPVGQTGELVMTNLGRWGQPVLRYRTGDLVRAATDVDSRDGGLLRLQGGILSRADDMLVIRGNNVFPSSIEAVLREFDAICEFRFVVQTIRAMQHLRIEIEPTPDVAANADQLRQLMERIERTLKARLNFQAELQVAPPGSLPRFELKGRRLVRES